MKFVFRDQNTGTVWWFDVDGPEITEETEDRIQNWCGDNKLETKFGIHDIEFQPDIELFGYTSYEVPEDKYLELMEIWRQFWITEPGYNVGKICKK